MLMSRPIDRFLFAAPRDTNHLRSFFSPRGKKKKKKRRRRRKKSEKKKEKFPLVHARSVKQETAPPRGEIERKVLPRGNWIANSRKGTMDTKVHRVPLPPLLSFSPDAGRNDSIFERERSKLSLARVSALLEWHLPRQRP